MAMQVFTDRNKSVQTLEYAHAAAHTDSFVIASDFQASVSTSGIDYLLVAPDDSEVHVVFAVTTSEISQVEIYEGPTVTDNGTLINHMRCNRYSAKSNLFNYVSPTTTDDGTKLWDGFVNGGRGGSAVGGNTRTGEELVLPAGTIILVRVTPATNGEQIGYAAEYYEVPAGVNKP